METIINYKIKDFFKLEDVELIGEYLTVLNNLNPLKEIANPNYRWFGITLNNKVKTLQIKSVKELSFGEVSVIRNNFNEGSIDSIIESIKLVTGLGNKQITNFTIITFYGIVNYIQSELIEIANIENNELQNDSFDINIEAVNANERLSKFGVLTLIDNLAKEDILRWEAIEKLPYMTVLTKLIMDNEKNKIQQEIAEIQKKKQLKN